MRTSISAIFLCTAMTPLYLPAETILDDVTVQGSLCVGMDCQANENFGFDTLLFKENNLRIKFQDTSSSSGNFPGNDWQLTINDSSDGGLNYFSIDDVDGDTTPFRILAGARDFSLFVGTNGFIGLGTSTPARSLHILSGNGPAVRLEQDGTGGFPPITWDIIARENDLTITAGGNGVFRLEPDGNLTISGTLTTGSPRGEFPDYVFAPGYTLMPLDQLQQYVAANGHLPGIPSASQVAADGLNMTELQLGLLKKVEELTLYTLQQQDLISDLQAQVQALGAQQ